MKNILPAIALAISTSTLSAQEFSVMSVYDINSDQAGTSITYGFNPYGNVTPILSITHVATEYTRYGIGMNTFLGEYNDVQFKLNTQYIEQDGEHHNGSGLNLGFSIETPVAQNTNLVFGVNHFSAFNQSLNSDEGASVNAGLVVTF